jgi:hypothetical protein
MAMDGKPFGVFPSLDGAYFPAEVSGYFFPGNQLLVRKGRPFGTWRDSIFWHCFRRSFETNECADYTLRIV